MTVPDPTVTGMPSRWDTVLQTKGTPVPSPSVDSRRSPGSRHTPTRPRRRAHQVESGPGPWSPPLGSGRAPVVLPREEVRDGSTVPTGHRRPPPSVHPLVIGEPGPLGGRSQRSGSLLTLTPPDGLGSTRLHQGPLEPALTPVEPWRLRSGPSPVPVEKPERLVIETPSGQVRIHSPKRSTLPCLRLRIISYLTVTYFTHN